MKALLALFRENWRRRRAERRDSRVLIGGVLLTAIEGWL